LENPDYMQTPEDYDGLLKQLLSNHPAELTTLSPDDEAYLKMCIRAVRGGKPSLLVWQGDDGAHQFMLSGTEFGEAFKIIGRVLAALGENLSRKNE
jgi:hypothetical protein